VKISGSYTIRAAREALATRMTDPQAIASCLPGVENLNQVAPDQYEMAMTVAIGPVKGTFAGKIQLSDLNLPESYRMIVEGQGKPGFARGSGSVQLRAIDDQTTEIVYEGDVELGGPFAGVAQRMLGGVAKRMIEQFFACIERQMGAQA
jgi:carbon monoxide dehydrogenase subunit G